MIVACYLPLPLSACILHFDIVSIFFGTSIPTSFHILMKCFYIYIYRNPTPALRLDGPTLLAKDSHATQNFVFTFLWKALDHFSIQSQHAQCIVWYRKLCGSFKKFAKRHSQLFNKYDVSIKTDIQEGMLPTIDVRNDLVEVVVCVRFVFLCLFVICGCSRWSAWVVRVGAPSKIFKPHSQFSRLGIWIIC